MRTCSTCFLALLVLGLLAGSGDAVAADRAVHENAVYNSTLNIWVPDHVVRIPPAVQSQTAKAGSSGHSSREISIIHSFGFPAGWSYARDAAWDGTSLWICENMTSKIFKIDPVSGNVLYSFFAQDSNPWGLAWDGTNLHNATVSQYHYPPGDTLPDWAYTLSISGSSLNSWLVPDSPDATPHGAAYDPVAGSLWLSDGYYTTIYEIDPSNGNVLSSFPFPGTDPRGMGWDGTYLYVIDNPSLTLYMLDTTGSTIDTVSIASLGNDPEGLTWDGQYFWVTENETDAIYQIDLGLGPLSTVSAALTCDPASGTLPFGTLVTAMVANTYTGSARRMGARIEVLTAGGLSIPNLRKGSVTIPPGGSVNPSFTLTIPAFPTMIGSNSFTLIAEDVTPAPYNQPPYPPSGDTDSDACTVTGIAP